MTTGRREYRKEKYPSFELDVCQENIDLFFTFMHDRHTAWRNRFIKKLPRDQWTDNEILKKTKYTNIYRQLDRGSLWVIHILIIPAVKKYRLCMKNGEKKLAVRYFTNMLWKLMFYRFCCRIESFEKTGIPGWFKFDPVAFYQNFNKVTKYHAPMTNAFLTCPCPSKWTKIDGFMLNAIDAWLKLKETSLAIRKATCGKDVFKALREIRGMGPFFAYEVYCDLCYSKLIPFTTDDFVNIGPGCQEGLRFLYPSITTSKMKAEEKLYLLWNEQDAHFKRLGLRFPYTNWLEPKENHLSLRCIEHSLCEFSKYWLQINRLGKRRLEYDRWKGSDNFRITDGINVEIDEDIYDNFNRMSSSYRPCQDWKKFTARCHDDYDKEDVASFVAWLRDKHGPSMANSL